MGNMVCNMEDIRRIRPYTHVISPNHLSFSSLKKNKRKKTEQSITFWMMQFVQKSYCSLQLLFLCVCRHQLPFPHHLLIVAKVLMQHIADCVLGQLKISTQTFGDSHRQYSKSLYKLWGPDTVRTL